jgi:hypothetical protein
MRVLWAAVVIVGLGLAPAGCGPRKSFDGPTVDAFVGKLVQNGKPVTLPPGETVVLSLFHETGQSFGVPIKADASFKIGWMPIGKYSATLVRETKGKGQPKRYNIPGGLTIEAGKTEYSVELGPEWKP